VFILGESIITFNYSLVDYYLIMENTLLNTDADKAIRAADIHATTEHQAKLERTEQNKDKLIQYIRENVIGHHSEYFLKTCYGEKPLVYADYTASGKSLKFIE
jgi:hypothetical protein